MTSPAAFAAKCQRIATTVPRAQKVANTQVARALKPMWMAQAGVHTGSTIGGRRVSIGDSTVGTGTVTTLLRWQGPVHLIEGPTRQHFMTARRLTTRAGARRLAGRIGAMAAFEGSNRGAFGTLRKQQKNGNSKRALTIGSNLRAWAFHPGTKGKRFWARNKATAHEVSTAVYRQAALPAILREAGFA